MPSWLASPVTDAEWISAHRANALFDAHREDLEFGYRLLVDQGREIPTRRPKHLSPDRAAGPSTARGPQHHRHHAARPWLPWS
jgi:hypothetical protein